MTTVVPADELEALTRLRQREEALDQALAQARAEASARVERGRAEAAQLRAAARDALARELAELEAELVRTLARDAETVRARAAGEVVALRDRAARRRDEVADWLAGLVAGGAP
ncbi:hypothetical protein [Anaeromyxobacter paludicola]|uniref:Uncharacterized protein n=1 Tax=Anaeromyxobacter paludicola TaxID=2918171 RepID=A0ABM7X8N3_9BACT|nr:hypothetical protein [Anaeromyxobacter paludicola]BDG08181.1 hypothetical protein AMPC_12940 [Anaeromyxobacter paludicola]